MHTIEYDHVPEKMHVYNVQCAKYNHVMYVYSLFIHYSFLVTHYRLSFDFVMIL